jgi:hypothetical protein
MSSDRDEAPAAGPHDATDELPPGADPPDTPRSERGDVGREQPYDEAPMT